MYIGDKLSSLTRIIQNARSVECSQEVGREYASSRPEQWLQCR